MAGYIRCAAILFLAGLAAEAAIAGSVIDKVKAPKVAEAVPLAATRAFLHSGWWDPRVVLSTREGDRSLAIPMVGPPLSPLILLAALSLDSPDWGGAQWELAFCSFRSAEVSPWGLDADQPVDFFGGDPSPGETETERILPEFGLGQLGIVATGTGSGDALGSAPAADRPGGPHGEVRRQLWRKMFDGIAVLGFILLVTTIGFLATKSERKRRRLRSEKKHRGRRLLQFLSELSADRSASSSGRSGSTRGRSGSSRGRSGSSRGRSGHSGGRSGRRG